MKYFCTWPIISFLQDVVETKSIRELQEELAMLTQARPPGDTAHSCHETSVSSACPQPASRLSQGWQHSSRRLWSLQCPPLTMMGHRVRAKWTFHIIQGGSSGIALTLSSYLGVLIKGLYLVFDAFSFVWASCIYFCHSAEIFYSSAFNKCCFLLLFWSEHFSIVPSFNKAWPSSITKLYHSFLHFTIKHPEQHTQFWSLPFAINFSLLRSKYEDWYIYIYIYKCTHTHTK